MDIVFERIPVLDHGYVSLIEKFGSDERIIESARMSTGKGFKGWGPGWFCTKCEELYEGIFISEGSSRTPNNACYSCGSIEFVQRSGDEKLLAYLYKNKHMTPFEMAGATFEVQAPIFVFREWHRHRTQSYNEMSARYVPMPDECYVPSLERILSGANTATTNKQAQGSGKILTEQEAAEWVIELKKAYEQIQAVYEQGIELGVPKELARLPVSVSRYSKMRVSTDLRNWLAFLVLRKSDKAQYEIRVYAEAICKQLQVLFPRTMELFLADE